ncbi:MAG TPA: diacylglycerol kinase family protein [Syntrophomonadaceae bacterium]|nr:diacylglycerol kinase family protein [Syntrophomonadaceae bacterium]
MKSRNLLESLYYAFQGVIYGFSSERNLKIHLLAAVSMIGVGCYFGINRWEWALLLFTIFLVVIAETINTAIEKTIDLVTKEYHPLAKSAKNLAAGAVLLSAINAIIMGVIIFGPYLW